MGRKLGRVGCRPHSDDGQQSRILLDGLMTWYTGKGELNLEGHSKTDEGLQTIPEGFNREGSGTQVRLDT